MKGIAMKTASVVAFAVFCSIIGAAAVYGEEVVTEPIRTFGGHTVRRLTNDGGHFQFEVELENTMLAIDRVAVAAKRRA